MSTPVPHPEELRANATYAALLNALARPGQVQTMPAPGEAPIIEALVDRECTVFCADPALIPLAAVTGAEIAELPQADHAFLGKLTDARLLEQVATGSDLYPDDGAMVVLRAHLGDGPRVRLSGPGIHGTCEIAVSGLPMGLWEIRKRAIRYPRGFELFLIDGAQVLGLPRSTGIEVL